MKLTPDLSLLDKNTLYHQILNILRSTQDVEQASTIILQNFIQFLANKEVEESSIPTIKSNPYTGKLFRRVG